MIPIIEINGRFTLSTYVSFVQEKKKLANAVLLVSYNNYSGLKKQLQEKNICYKDNHGLFVYNSESITKRRVGENGRMFGILM